MCFEQLRIGAGQWKFNAHPVSGTRANIEQWTSSGAAILTISRQRYYFVQIEIVTHLFSSVIIYYFRRSLYSILPFVRKYFFYLVLNAQKLSSSHRVARPRSCHEIIKKIWVLVSFWIVAWHIIFLLCCLLSLGVGIPLIPFIIRSFVPHTHFDKFEFLSIDLIIILLHQNYFVSILKKN